MAIDLQTETIIPVRKVPDLLGPIGRNGKKPCLQQIMRGVLDGLNGAKLEAFKHGSHWLTSVEAVQRWLEAQAANSIDKGQAPTPQPPASRRRQHERAVAELSSAGF